MKTEKIKGFIIGVVVMTLVFSTAATGFAATGSKAITAAYNNIKIYVNQKLVTPKDASGNSVEPFIYNGTTYLPVRAVADALGQDVSWDGATKSIYIGSQAESTPAKTSYSRSNPAPLGTSQNITVDNILDSYNATITVNSVIRGSEAQSKVKKANMFNPEAPEGYEYLVANITIKADSVEDDAAIDVSGYNFTAYSSNNEEYDRTIVVEPSPELNGKIYSGGSQTGNVIFLVKPDDAAPKIVYGDRYDGTGGIWFRLY